MDRNRVVAGSLTTFGGSLSARRAWIEISRAETAKTSNADVALRKESVDRNIYTVQVVIVIMQSLSARRAWIEMDVTAKTGLFTSVALRKESVDRNSCWLLA